MHKDTPVPTRQSAKNGACRIRKGTARAESAHHGRTRAEPTVACRCKRGSPHSRRRPLATVHEQGGPSVDSEGPRANGRGGWAVSGTASGDNQLQWRSSGTLLVVDDDPGVL